MKSTAVVSKTGKVTAKRKGTATITAKVGEKSYECKITVETPKISKRTLFLDLGHSHQLRISGTNQKVSWTTSKKSVADVTSSGKVIAKKEGTVTITATVNKMKFSCYIYVYDSSKYITRAKYNKIEMGMTYSQVVEIIGSKGTSVLSAVYNSNTYEAYEWEGYLEGMDTCTIVFTNGKVTLKMQNSY